MIQGERYKRQSELDLRVDQAVAVIGCGGIGSWAAFFLGLSGVATLHVFDQDRVEMVNLNRLPLGLQHLGMAKSEAVAQLINDSRGEMCAIPHTHFEPKAHGHILEACRWAMVSTDSLKSRRMVYEACTRAAVRYVEMSSEGLKGSVFFEPADFQTSLEDNPGYASVPVFVGPCVVAAAVAAHHVLLGTAAHDLVMNFGWDESTQSYFFKSRKVKVKLS